MITESEIVSPPPTTWIAAAMSIGPSRRNTNQATTAIWPANIAAKTNSPHSAVPQNFQIRGGRCAGMTGASRGGDLRDFRGNPSTGFQLTGSARSSNLRISSVARSTAPYMLA